MSGCVRQCEFRSVFSATIIARCSSGTSAVQRAVASVLRSLDLLAVSYCSNAFSALTLLVGRQEEQTVWARGRCRISPPRFLAEFCRRQLNQGSFVLLYFRFFFTFSDLY